VANAKAAKTPTSPAAGPSGSDYTVVARRYRPQRFEDVVGQDHVVQALRNAIRLNRVTHAYLFSGTRGVGKTSIARIFAKCLNCVHGPTVEPCLECEACRAIAVGQDIDVIEIDGASNNGVESVRELRQNAGLRPSRARFKIYYIDEVHMLSTGAFNALLKTLEEPPGHVKFFFATTEPNKIPVTVLSRCQRYDFAGIAPDQIVETLRGICAREGIEAEPEALQAVARRAGGSMRDAQSLLEQLLSAGGEGLTVERVHALLGTASDERLLDLLDALADRDPAAALSQVDRASREGVQPAELLNGLLDYLRDVMVLAAGAEAVLLSASPRQKARLQAVVDRWPLDSILAALQILAEARGRLRGSPHGRILVELALARVARLEDLAEVGELVARLSALESGASPPSAPSPVKKKSAEPEPSPPQPAPPKRATAAPPRRDPAPPMDDGAPPLDLDAVRQSWPGLARLVGLEIYAKKGLGQALPTAISGPNVLVIALPARYNWVADECDTPEVRSRIEEGLEHLLHRRVSVRFERSAEEAEAVPHDLTAGGGARRDELEQDPIVQKVVQLFEARRIRVDPLDGDQAPP
jgi:DNA polymerase III subunit gamma/tau